MATLIYPKSNIPLGTYRVMILDVEEIYVEDYLCMSIKYLLLNQCMGMNYTFDEVIMYNRCMKSNVDLFDLLKAYDVEFDRFEDLNGLVFDAELDCVKRNGKEVIALTERKLVAKP